MKKSKLSKDMLKDIIYGSLKELSYNDKIYYHSGFGNQYSHIKEEAVESCLLLLQELMVKVRETEEQIYEDRKKQDTFDAFKNENQSN